jgi:glyceraldehyde 3-phosphate dehydrogenase
MPIKVGINGFGRIGRYAFRAMQNKNIEIVAINTQMNTDTLAQLLKNDSEHGEAPFNVEAGRDHIKVSGRKIHVTADDVVPGDFRWSKLGVEVVLESTGLYYNADKARRHINAGATKVIISSPTKNEDVTLVSGVNFISYDKAKHNIISSSSCSTNCLAPVLKVINESFGVEYGTMINIQTYINDQEIYKFPQRDSYETRAIAMRLIPTAKGTLIDLGKVIPELNGKIDGYTLRVSTFSLSAVEFSCTLKKHTTAKEINEAIKEAEDCKLRAILGYTEKPLRSIDFNSRPNSSTFDARFTKIVDHNKLQVLSWYDNEWGYVNRISELITRVL